MEARWPRTHTVGIKRHEGRDEQSGSIIHCAIMLTSVGSGYETRQKAII